jgi:DNA polymerase III epsilon subunit family exonuclease
VTLPLGPRLRRALDRLEAAGEPLAIDELARRLFALRAPLDPRLARHLVATALGCSAERLPDRLDLRALPRLVAVSGAELALEDVEWIAVDLETTGLSAARAAILEIGAVRLVGLRPVDRFQTLVDPGVPIPPAITSLTGIDRSAIGDAPPIGRAIGAFRAWVGDRAGTAFAAHNAAFDAGFVRRAFAEHRLAPWPGPVVCTRQLARRLLPGLPRYDLDTLCAHLGIANAWRHRALGDAEAAARALLELLGRGRSAGGLRSLGDLLELQSSRTRRSRAARRSRVGAGPPKP